MNDSFQDCCLKPLSHSSIFNTSALYRIIFILQIHRNCAILFRKKDPSWYNNSTMEWEVLQHSYTEKNNDWYASVIIIAGALVVVEFMMNNFLLIALTIIATCAFILAAARRPDMMKVEIKKNGIRIEDTFYPYHNLDAFAIIDYTPERRLLLESTKKMMPLIVVHMPDDLDPEELRAELEQYLPEKELHESLPHLLFERFGF